MAWSRKKDKAMGCSGQFQPVDSPPLERLGFVDWHTPRTIRSSGAALAFLTRRGYGGNMHPGPKLIWGPPVYPCPSLDDLE